MSVFSKIKDGITTFAGSIILKKKLERYGTMMDFKIDSENKKIFLKISLKGEAKPLDITVNRYALVKQGNEEFIVIEDVTISKEWMNLLAADLLNKKEFKLPGGIASTIAKMIL
jgi:hypothetical protein